MEQRIIDLLNRIFDDFEIDKDSSIENIETWDSMNQLNIAFEIEKEFGVSLEPEELSKLVSTKDIVEIVAKKVK